MLSCQLNFDHCTCMCHSLTSLLVQTCCFNAYTNISAEDANRLCADGKVRLVGGGRSGEGRVQMCFNGIWGSVCAIGFDEPEAQVTCRNLGFNIETTSEFIQLGALVGIQLMLSDLST